MIITRLLRLAQNLDDAGLTKEADMADKIAQMWEPWEKEKGEYDDLPSFKHDLSKAPESVNFGAKEVMRGEPGYMSETEAGSLGDLEQVEDGTDFEYSEVPVYEVPDTTSRESGYHGELSNSPESSPISDEIISWAENELATLPERVEEVKAKIAELRDSLPAELSEELDDIFSGDTAGQLQEEVEAAVAKFQENIGNEEDTSSSLFSLGQMLEKASQEYMMAHELIAGQMLDVEDAYPETGESSEVQGLAQEMEDLSVFIKQQAEKVNEFADATYMSDEADTFKDTEQERFEDSMEPIGAPGLDFELDMVANDTRIFSKIVRLAQKLDDAGLTKEADYADSIAKMAQDFGFDDEEDMGGMDEFDDTVGFGPHDSEAEALEAAEYEDLGVDKPGKESDDSSAVALIDEMLSNIDMLEGFEEPDNAELQGEIAELRDQLTNLQQQYFGGATTGLEELGDAGIIDEAPDTVGWGAEDLTGKPPMIPAAEASRRDSIKDIVRKAKRRLKKTAGDPASEMQAFYKEYIGTGQGSPFFDNAEGFGLPYQVADDDAKNYTFAFKLDDTAKPIAGSYVAQVNSRRPENRDLTQKHLQTLEQIANGVNWADQYPGIAQYVTKFSATTIGPLEWTGEIQYSGGELNFDE